MALHRSTSVTALSGVGPTAAADLRNLGIISLGDLLMHLPFRYDDYSHTPNIADIRPDQAVTVTARVRSIATHPSKTNPHLKITEAMLEDDTGTLKAMWFNQPFLEKVLKPGTNWAFAGKTDAKFGGLSLMNPVHEPPGMNIQTGRMVPVYGLAGSLTQNRLRRMIVAALPVAAEFEEWLPSHLVKTENFPSLAEALHAIHAPPSPVVLTRTIERLKFDELFLHQLMFAAVREQCKMRPAHPLPIDESFLKAFVASLPFTLTNAQRRAAWEIIQDCAKFVPMNRLLEGDVGSGKSVVAAMAIAHAVHRGEKAAYLAPTEILAEQQQAALQKFLPDLAVGLLTGNRARIGSIDMPRNKLLVALAAENIHCLVGTHALIQDGLKLPHLSLVVVDEQHRFGVQQRHTLLGTEGEAPHLLSMTATPIPRSLALTLYGDLDISILHEYPKGRKLIVTKIVPELQAKAVWSHVLDEVKKGRQAYIVCPLIESEPSSSAWRAPPLPGGASPDDSIGRGLRGVGGRGGSASVTELGKTLKAGPFKDYEVGILHGKLKSDEKTSLLCRFRDGEVDILVSTTVVEVGVDVPNATVMVVVGAERFGLAQLHQLRGRVGRSDLSSFCYLVSQDASRASSERLSALVDCNDGFVLAEKDLQLRGSGNVFGDAQSGFPDFKLATIADIPLMKRARDIAQRLCVDDPRLEGHPLLAARVHSSFEQVHLE